MEELLANFNEIESFHWWWEGRREIIRKVIKSLEKSPKKILDVGCGTGETLNFINKLQPKSKLYGVDNSSVAVKYSKQNTKAVIYKANAHKLPFKSNSFDLVLFLDVLEHIKDDKKALLEAKRILKTGGVVIITCPATSFIWSRHDTRQGHERRYSNNDILKLSKKVGMKIKFLNFFNFFLFLPISVIRLSSKIPFLSYLSKYDDSINYSIAKISSLNRVLRKIIVFEVNLMFKLRFPVGVSIVAVFKK